jgi:hypothetical protein
MFSSELGSSARRSSAGSGSHSTPITGAPVCVGNRVNLFGLIIDIGDQARRTIDAAANDL